MSTLKATGVSRWVWRQTCDGPVQIGQHLGRLQMPPGLVDHDLDGGVLQIDQLPQGGVQRQARKNSGSMRRQTLAYSFYVQTLRTKCRILACW